MISDVEGAGEVAGLGAAVGACGADNGTWWWGCNACRCVGGAPACTRLWCGLTDLPARGRAARGAPRAARAARLLARRPRPAARRLRARRAAPGPRAAGARRARGASVLGAAARAGRRAGRRAGPARARRRAASDAAV
ncbi:unnamed protein product [Leptidea sinapis]|uniref:Pacifastin domain-containing protein n=1 Tax=Leptidea sinapis TaxID=189913 RepID=A0A5E4Q1X3_9NEOP|nr:unnamed protein product [Leptidea sinapis]